MLYDTAQEKLQRNVEVVFDIQPKHMGEDILREQTIGEVRGLNIVFEEMKRLEREVVEKLNPNKAEEHARRDAIDTDADGEPE